MFTTLLITLTLLLLTSLTSAAQACTASKRLTGAKQIPYAYNLTPFGASSAAFDQVPFALLCQTSIAANGAPPLPVAIDRTTTELFAKATRQLFSEVTGEYVDFPKNQTTLILTNVTLGVRDTVPVPITFAGQVYLDYDGNCQIQAVRAFAQVPTQVLGLILNPPGLPAGIL